jgi:hypothetical protein
MIVSELWWISPCSLENNDSKLTLSQVFIIIILDKYIKPQIIGSYQYFGCVVIGWKTICVVSYEVVWVTISCVM